MKRTAFLAVSLIVIALLGAVPVFSGTIPASVVPEGARWIAHLDMEKFVGTSLYGYLEKSGNFEIKPKDLDRFMKIDIPKDITGVTVFGFGPGEKQVVFAVAGKFDKAGMIAMINASKEHQETPYGSYTVYSSGDDGYGAFVTDSLIVFSEGREALEKVLDTAAAKAKSFAGTELHASLKAVPAGAFLSGVLPDLGGLGKEIGQSKVLENASGLFFLAQEKQDNLLIRVQLTAASPETAKNMVDIVNGLVALGRMSATQGQGEDQAKMAQMTALLEGLKIQQDGKVLKLEFERPSKEIADLISSRHGLKGLMD
jgi:hypothetical protein